MALKLSCLITTTEFHNLNLYHQGYYYIRYRLFTETEGTRYFAQPNRVVAKFKQRQPEVSTSINGTITENEYRTEGFKIVYIGESISLNESVTFNHCVNLSWGVAIEDVCIPLLLEASLHSVVFQDIKDPQYPPTADEYKIVNSKVFRLGDVMKGVFKYCPVQFTGEYTSLLETSVHAIVSDIEVSPAKLIRINQNLLECSEKQNTSEAKNNDPWFMINLDESNLYISDVEDPKQNMASKNSQKINFVESIFLSDESWRLHTVTPEEERGMNRLLWDVLASQFNTLRRIYKDFYKQLDKETKLSELKIKAKKKSYKGRDPTEDGQENYISEDENYAGKDQKEENKISINFIPTPMMLRKSDSYDSDQSIEESCDFGMDINEDSPENKRKLIGPIARVNSDNFSKEIPFLELKEGASKKQGESIEEIIDEMIKSKDLLKKDLNTLWSQYKAFLRYNAKTQKELHTIMKKKHSTLFKKLVNKIVTTEKNARLDTELTKEFLRSVDAKADELRELYTNSYIDQKESSRGLVHRRHDYKKDFMPIIFEQVIPKGSLEQESESNDSLEETKTPSRKKEKKPTKGKVHYFFLMHGYASSSDDMEFFASCIRQKLDNCYVYCCSKAQGDNDAGILELGEIIAEEIRLEIGKAVLSGDLGKISFVGHSQGGLVLRAALPQLESFKSYFHGFVTLATPHAGYVHSKSKILSVGIWALSKVGSAPTIPEIRLSDSSEIEECALYRLSQYKGLDWFKYVILSGSFQDLYAPIESALLQISARSPVYQQICENLYQNLNKTKVYRASVHFKLGSSIDSFIGRKGHIQFLENFCLMKTIIAKYDCVFKDIKS
ncbi:unnamed protein product [Moneuplotes crassus]|uniref:DUF676 domain-containing protein n=1 Tax=Euplotes crassus TaxID=5936 RepID=A0AAD2D904_EUPCR|nr:unnamed protein product [Moneuplotes crassus]